MCAGAHDARGGSQVYIHMIHICVFVTILICYSLGSAATSMRPQGSSSYLCPHTTTSSIFKYIYAYIERYYYIQICTCIYR